MCNQKRTWSDRVKNRDKKLRAHSELRFYYQLARVLGGMTVEEMLDRISSIELVQWQAFFELENEEEEFRARKSRR